ncbi:MAG: pitrilysin family protein [Ignavibacteriales bacterium]|nr:pitrilysin family protein [Ignavibacteriales bacterium]
MRYQRSLFIVLMICCLCIQAASAEKKQETSALPKGVTITALSNGMKVLLIENPALPMVGVNVIVKVGSAYETTVTSGMSHMLEHLLFNGTTTREQKRLYDDVDRIGGYNNASTAEFYTNYMMVTPTEHIRKGMEIQADMLFNSILPNDKFEKEKGIVLEEISKSIAAPEDQLGRNILAFLYPGHALSNSTLGTYSTIQSMKRDSVNVFYKNFYVPNNMILSVIGSFKSAAMLTAIKEIYGKPKAGTVLQPNNPDWATGFQVPKGPIPQSMMGSGTYDGAEKVIDLFFPLPQEESAEFFDILGVVTDKAKAGIQSSLKKEFPKSVKSMSFARRLSHLGNYFEVSIILSGATDSVALAKAVSSKLGALQFTLPEQTLKSEIAKIRTEYFRNTEKPHMFGIYNSEDIVKNGLESIFESMNSALYYQAAKKLESFRLTSSPLLLLQNPSGKKAKTEGMNPRMMMPR